MPSSQQLPPPAASTLSRPATRLAATAAAANAISATPLREGRILRRTSQLEVGSPPNNLPASPAASLPSNSSAVAPQQPASPSPAPSAQGKAKNKATGNKSKTADSSQQGKPRFQWARGSSVVVGLHPEGHFAGWAFTKTGREGVTEEDIEKDIDTWDKKLRSFCSYYYVLSATLGTTNADLTDGNRVHNLFDNGISTPALLQQAIGNKEAEELGEPDLFMTINHLMNEDISSADEGGDCVEDDKGSAANAKKLAKEIKGKGKFRRNEAFHKVQDNIIQMMLEVNAVDQKGRMELAAFQAEAEATARAEEREAREARWKIEDERDSLVRTVEMKRMQAESARYSAEAALRNAEAKKVAEEHQICMAKRKRGEEEAMDGVCKEDAVEAEKQAYWEITGKEKPF
ncbi:hypothetical protein D1P53_006047 [Cryptococcus gattii VGV]|nr:hypothetical protein D1P53_006047 [Cryptococcus gattii VGV]